VRLFDPLISITSITDSDFMTPYTIARPLDERSGSTFIKILGYLRRHSTRPGILQVARRDHARKIYRYVVMIDGSRRHESRISTAGGFLRVSPPAKNRDPATYSDLMHILKK